MPHSLEVSATPNLLVIGGGNMGSAIVLGALRAGVLHSGNVVVAEPDPLKRESLARQGVPCVATATEALNRTISLPNTQLLLAIKPQMLPDLARECAALLTVPRIIISILAGTTGSKIHSLLGSHHHVVRAMPSLPASIGLSTTAMCLSSGAKPGDDAFSRQLFAAIGPTILSIREDQMDAFTAVAGSGPAYLFYLAEAMQFAATQEGFDPSAAAEMTRSTLLGAATMLSKSTSSAPDLRRQVTSKGGTTEAAIATFDSHNVAQSIAAGIAAGAARARELH